MRLVCRLAEVQGEAVMALVPWLHSASRLARGKPPLVGSQEERPKGRETPGSSFAACPC